MLRVFRAELTVLAAALTMALASSGCTSFSQYVRNGFKVGPNYCPPPAPVAEHWIDAADVRQESEDMSQWWRVFNDPVLDRLIDCAYRQNLSLREAGFRILQARAQRGIAVGRLFPQTQDAFGKYVRQASGLREASGGAFSDQFSNQWSLGFNLAWELDFWGRFRRAVIAADATLDASVNDYDFVLVTLLADVAQNYVQICQDEERIRYLIENVEQQDQIVKYWEARTVVSFGTDPRLNRDQTRSLQFTTEAGIPELEIELRQANDRLCVLLGIPTVDLREALDFWKAEEQRKREELRRVKQELQRAEQEMEQVRKMSDQSKVEQARNELKQRIQDLRNSIDTVFIPRVPRGDQVAVGIPAQLLWRRPDVRRAERQAAAQAEQIGIAEADFYPAISINGDNLGYQAPKFPQMFSSHALNGSIGPSLKWNILNYGRILNNVRLQDATFQALVTAYQNTVLQANAEVEDGLVKFLKEQSREKLLKRGVDDLQDAVDYMFEQYRVSKIDVNRYIVIAQNLVQQQDSLATSRGQITQGLVQVYRALGGGWQMCLGLLPQETMPPDAAAVPPGPLELPEPVPAPPAVPGQPGDGRINE